jgi:eukaryotic-like serine/threonine-protein kinase
MAKRVTCPVCGAALPQEALKGICPRCLVKVAFGVSTLPAGPALERVAPASATVGRDTAASAAVAEAGGSERIGRYRLLEPIGEGGCGVVYLAEQQEPVRRRVALKIIKLGMDTKQVMARFEAERQALAMMDHPNIAQVFDAAATETGRPYFVMELVRGTKITDYCDQHHLLTAERLKLFIQVCHAVQHAHQKGVIHRDIKPSNILVTMHDERPVPKVIDFGIAKAIREPLTNLTLYTRFEQFLGTPAYASPEQAGPSGLDVDTRSDIYSLGVLLYELLTGRTPFDSQQLAQAGMEEVLRRIREEEPPRPSTRLRTLPASEITTTAQLHQTEPPRLISLLRGDLDWIVMKCLEKDRTRRYETANALAADVERYLDDQPVSAAAPTAGYRLAKFARRHRSGLAVAGAFVLLLAAGSVISVWEAVRANRARAVAERREAESRQHLWASLLATARASRLSGQPGRRFAALEAAAQAAAIRPSPELRSEAANALALVDVRPGREWKGYPPGAGGLAMDARFDRYARYDGQGRVSVRRVEGDEEVLALSGRAVPRRFSFDGAFLLATDCGQPANFKVWNLRTGQLAVEGSLGQFCPWGADLNPRAPILAAFGATGRLEVFDLATGTRSFWPTNIPPGVIRFRPDGQQLAVASWNPPEVRVYETDSAKLVATLAQSNVVRFLDWSPDGFRLAGAGEDARVYLWNMGQGGAFECCLEAHDGPVTEVGFDPQGEFLVSQSWDGTTALWSLPTRKLVFKCPGSDSLVSFSADGRWLGPFVAPPTVRLLEVQRASAYRVLFAGVGSTQCNGAFSPEGRWILLGGEGLECWDSRTARRVWAEPIGSVRWVLFHPDGQRLLTFGVTGPREWPWSVDASTGAPRLGTPRHLPAGPTSQAEYSRDGSVLVMSQLEGLRVFDSRAPAPILFPMPMCNYAAVSPDGRWAAATPWSDHRDLKVWDLVSQKEAFRRDNVGSAIAFAPNGRWLVTVWGDFFECLEVGTWRTIAHVPRDRVWFSAVVSPDSRWLASEPGGSGRLHLLDLPTFQTFLALDAAAGKPYCFSPDGTLLLTRTSGGQFGLWNLRLVREELSRLGLGW